MKQPPETIYLIPGEDIDGQLGWLWCDDPAPGEGMDPAEAVKYVRADVHQELVAEARTEKDSAMDAETVAWGELERVRSLLSELFLAFPPVQSKEHCDLMKRVSREIGGEK
jgi:hypothetical protein